MEVKPTDKKDDAILKMFSTPMRPEYAWRRIEQKKLMSRATFFRHFKKLKENSLIEISEEDKKKFGIQDKGRYYYVDIMGRAEEWNEIMKKVRSYDGNGGIENLLWIIAREENGYSLYVKPKDLDDIVKVYMQHGEGEGGSIHHMLKLLHQQADRMSRVYDPQELESLKDTLFKLFEEELRDLLGSQNGKNVNKTVLELVSVLCSLSSDDPSSLMRRVFDTIIKQREAGEKIGLKADLFMDLYKENKECFRGEQMIMDLLKKYVKDLRKESIDSYKDSILMDSYKKQADALESIYKALTKN